LVGYALAALDAKQFHKKMELAWLPEMCQKYPQPELAYTEELKIWFHTFKGKTPEPEHKQRPSIMCCSLLISVFDQIVAKQLVTCLLAALPAYGSFRVYVPVNF
jgi:protein O-GlcNAcase/histone acetyltransferase